MPEVKQSFETPGSLLARAIFKLSDGKNPQGAQAAGKVTDIIGASALGGAGLGYLIHRSKLRKSEKELEEIGQEKESSAVVDKLSDLLVGLFTAVPKLNIAAAKKLQSPAPGHPWTQARTGPLPGGWVVPALAFGVPAAAIAGERASRGLVEKQRAAGIARKKDELRSEFSRLLQSPADEDGEKQASARTSCEALLDTVAPRAAVMVKESVSGPGLMGGLYTWWLLSGILAFNKGKSVAKGKDTEAKSLKDMDAYNKSVALAEPVRFELAPHTDVTQPPRRISTAGPYTLPVPDMQKDAFFGAIKDKLTNAAGTMKKYVDTTKRLVKEYPDIVDTMVDTKNRVKSPGFQKSLQAAEGFGNLMGKGEQLWSKIKGYGSKLVNTGVSAYKGFKGGLSGAPKPDTVISDFQRGSGQAVAPVDPDRLQNALLPRGV